MGVSALPCQSPALRCSDHQCAGVLRMPQIERQGPENRAMREYVWFAVSLMVVLLLRLASGISST